MVRHSKDTNAHERKVCVHAQAQEGVRDRPTPQRNLTAGD